MWTLYLRDCYYLFSLHVFLPSMAILICLTALARNPGSPAGQALAVEAACPTTIAGQSRCGFQNDPFSALQARGGKATLLACAHELKASCLVHGGTAKSCRPGAGRGSERGSARPEVLKALLQTTERVVQEVDSVEYGLTDIQVYLSRRLLRVRFHWRSTQPSTA